MEAKTYDNVAVSDLPKRLQQGLDDRHYVRVRVEPTTEIPTVGMTREEALAFFRSLDHQSAQASNSDIFDYLDDPNFVAR